MQILISQLLAFQPHSPADPQPIRDDKGMLQPLCNPTPKAEGSNGAAQGPVPEMNRPHHTSERPQSRVMIQRPHQQSERQRSRFMVQGPHQQSERPQSRLLVQGPHQ